MAKLAYKIRAGELILTKEDVTTYNLLEEAFLARGGNPRANPTPNGALLEQFRQFVLKLKKQRSSRFTVDKFKNEEDHVA